MQQRFKTNNQSFEKAGKPRLIHQKYKQTEVVVVAERISDGQHYYHPGLGNWPRLKMAAGVFKKKLTNDTRN